ncbi:MAG: NAD(+)/NADH kinase [Planctomycetes bacterium]|nr:NAD(+)/NADH kinase [Planctomycetota bacterium]MBI3846630.1 NAD(+)/NADH kinase [Planctomycetota bacterium]
MASTRVPRAVLVTRATDYERLVARHGTRAQAAFFLETRGQKLDEIDARHHAFESALAAVLHAIPDEWRRSRVDRADLDRFLFEPDDIVVALGQDGLVANVAKYLTGQPVIGLNPAPDVYEGVLVPHSPNAARELLHVAASGHGRYEARSMVEADLDDGQRLVALNEIYVGHRTHQSARYRLRVGEKGERHSSSGVITASGTGSTGWARSIQRQRRSPLALPTPTSGQLVYFVREAWPSINTQTSLTEGLLAEGTVLEITSEMDDDGVIFGDGIEVDRLEFSWGRRVTLHTAATRLRLLVAC